MAPVCDILLLSISYYQMNWDVLMREFVGRDFRQFHDQRELYCEILNNMTFMDQKQLLK